MDGVNPSLLQNERMNFSEKIILFPAIGSFEEQYSACRKLVDSAFKVGVSRFTDCVDNMRSLQFTYWKKTGDLNLPEGAREIK